MKLITNRCLIRPLTLSDAEALHAILSDEDVMRYMEPPFSLEQTESFIREAGMCQPPLVHALVWKETDCVIGHVIFHPYEADSCEIGWVLAKTDWNKGFASEVTERLITAAWDAGYQSCVIECDPRQTVSAHIAQKAGFLPDGTANGCIRYRLKRKRGDTGSLV